MKVLLVGAKRSLADALAAQNGLDVTLLWPHRHGRADTEKPAGFHERWYAGGQKLNLRAALQMRTIVCELRPDIVHAFYGRALAHIVLAAHSIRRPPAIVSFRGITSPLSPFNLGDWLSYRHPLVRAHACESQAVREALAASGIDAAQCWVTFNTMGAAPANRPGRRGLAQFDIPGGALVVGTIATMRRVKGIDILLRAAAACSDLRDVYWLLFGKVVDPEVYRLAADPRIRDRVKLVGHRQDASELISGADVFCMPSRAEALCQALLEAMHQGVCPMVSDAGGMKEVVRHGQDGMVVPAEDVAALAEAIRALHGDRRRIAFYAASAQARVAKEFTSGRMAERCLEIYRRVQDARQTRRAA